MNVIETTAPIELEELKLFFNDKDTFYLIHYEESTLQGSKLLTYLGNLEIPCDIGFTTQEAFDEILEEAKSMYKKVEEEFQNQPGPVDDAAKLLSDMVAMGEQIDLNANK